MKETLLEVRNLTTHFFTRAGIVRAVDGVSFAVGRGEILGIVGESGSGKSVLGYSLLGLVDEPGRIIGGTVIFEGQDLVSMPQHQLRSIRGRRLAMVFQDPQMTLNPLLTIIQQVQLAVLAHERASRRAIRARAVEVLTTVGIPEAASRLDAYPYEFSGGMRQRVAFAIALLHRPAMIVADEPTTALDVSIQAQILAEVKSLAGALGTSLIWISHDLATVSSLSDRITVMYAGKIVESGATAKVLRQPRHPYTQGLLNSLPARASAGKPLSQIRGTTPSLLDLPPGCPFAPRCPNAGTDCINDPPLVTEGERSLRCFHPVREAAA